MATVLLERIGRGLYPVDGVAEEEVRQLPAHVELRADVVQPTRRSLPQLRLYWAVLQLVAERMNNAGRAPIDKRTLHQWVKLKCGYVDDIVLRTGEIVEVPGSVALDRMDQDEFNRFFEKAMAAITAALTQVGRAELAAQAEALLDRGELE